MGGFVLYRIQPESRNDSNDSAVFSTFERKGLSRGVSIERDGFVLHLLLKRLDPTQNVAESANGNFIAATGTFAYRGLFCKSGLERILDDAEKEQIDWSEVSGNYCLILYRDGCLRVLTDPTGLYPVYCDPDKQILSSSFLAIARASRTRTLRTQEFYEFVFNAGFYADLTPLAEVERLSSQKIWQLVPELNSQPRPPMVQDHETGMSFEDLVESASSRLLVYFRQIQAEFGDRVCSALSGGYDSRLMLALARRSGIDPYLYVYGDKSGPDVMIAKAVAAAEDLSLDHIDKSMRPELNPNDFATRVRDDYFFYDGIGHESGVFDDGSDIDTRMDRAGKVRLQLNGGGGEIYRNFWKLPATTTKIREQVSTHFDTADFSVCRGPIQRSEYVTRLEEKSREVLGIEGRPTNRRDIERLYPLMRLQYWQGKNNSLNNQLTSALTPFAEGQFAFPSGGVPVAWKNHGRFEAAIIAQLDPALAALQSAYGHNFVTPPCIEATQGGHQDVQAIAIRGQGKTPPRSQAKATSLLSQRRLSP